MTLGMHIEGSTNADELGWLHFWAGKMGSVVEIGSMKGRSAYALCSSNCPHVYCVDPFPDDQYEIFMANVGHFPNLTVLKMSSEEAAKSDLIPAQVDMVWVDGNHFREGVLTDLSLWAPRTKVLICGHDYNWPSVYHTVVEYFDPDKIKIPPKPWADSRIWMKFVDNQKEQEYRLDNTASSQG